MSSNNKDYNREDSDNLCVVCFKNVEIYSIGICDHAVCFECSTRMRILCKQNECPTCRRVLPKVLFTKVPEHFSIIFPKFERSNLQDRRYGIIFATFDIQKEYYKLLEHRCTMCETPGQPYSYRVFQSFQPLKDHMRREHEMFYCDICTEHLKIFSYEREYYNRHDLGYHRRKGDKNNKSHKGHPLCEFCDTRFMDSDELFRHLRRVHFFCHLCDADGKHHYYSSLEDLKKHFKDEHFFCEEGDCKAVPFAAVFRTDIDLKAHITTEHCRYMSKSATRQARTLELEFTMAPRPRSDNNRARKPNDRRERFDDEGSSTVSYSVEHEGREGGFNNINQSATFVNPLTSEDFPALGGNSSNSSNITLVSKNYTKFSSAAFNSQDFPSLGGGGGPSTSRTAPGVTITANSAPGKPAPEVTITRTMRNQQQQQPPSQNKHRDNFPVLGGNKQTGTGSTVRLSVNSNSNKQHQAPKVSIQVNQKSNGAITTHITTSAPSTSSQKTDFFPALSKNSENKTMKQPQWVQPKPKKQEESKAAKVAACPVLETSDLNSFPNLSKSGNKSEKPKKTSSVTVPVDSWVNLNSMKNTPKLVNKSKPSNAEKVNENNNNNNSKLNDASGSSSSTNNNKRNDTNKKNNQKNANKALADLEAKLNGLKLIEVKKPESTNQSEDTKKIKKKRNKISELLNNNISDSSSKSNNTKNESVTELKFNENYNNESNGNTKKRSELKIGTLTSEDLVSNAQFPPLGPPQPPPGFSNKPPTAVTVKPPPPPGFNSDFSSLGLLSNDLTFTTSSGQSYAISPSTIITPQTYKQPQNFQTRNQNLIRRFMEVLNDDNDSIRKFKLLSDTFRKGEVEGKKYATECRTILGNKFNDIFPELLVLLPDIEKQQELFKEIRGKAFESLIVCENCKQVIYKRELREHYNYHRLENHFPTLGSAQQINSAWKN